MATTLKLRFGQVTGVEKESRQGMGQTDVASAKKRVLVTSTGST